MDRSEIEERLRRRMAEREAVPPLEMAREFLGAYVADADGGLDEVRSRMRNVAATSIYGLRLDLAAVEAVLAQPQPEGTLARLVGWDGNRVLEDPSDRGAAAFLAELAGMLREVIAEAESTRQ